MKKWLSIFFILSSLKCFSGDGVQVEPFHADENRPEMISRRYDPCNILVYWTVHIIGTGSGAVSLTSMSGYSMGDSALIATPTGTYTSFTFKNMDSITVIPQTVVPTFTTQSSWNSNRWCRILNLDFIYATGSNIAVQLNGGRDYHNEYAFLYFYGWSSSVFTKHNNVAYTYGDHTTSISDMETWHDITIDSCGQFLQGSFWNSSSNKLAPVDVFTNTTVYNIFDIGTSLQGGNGQGTGLRGVFFHLTVHDCYITDRSGRGADGDVGWVYLTGGSAHIWNIVKWGGPGYLYRNNNPLQEVGDPWDNQFSNSGKIGGTMYGLANIDAVLTDTVTGSTSGPTNYNWNLTLGNQINDTFGFWSPMINAGDTWTHNYCWNFLGYNIGQNQQRTGSGPNNNKNQLWVNLGGSKGWATMAGDTSNGIYSKSATLILLDTISVFYSNRTGSYSANMITTSTPNTIVHGGITGALTNPFADLGGSFPRTPPDLGFLQLRALTPSCNCHVRNRGKFTQVISH